MFYTLILQSFLNLMKFASSEYFSLGNYVSVK